MSLWHHSVLSSERVLNSKFWVLNSKPSVSYIISLACMNQNSYFYVVSVKNLFRKIIQILVSFSHLISLFQSSFSQQKLKDIEVHSSWNYLIFVMHFKIHTLLAFWNCCGHHISCIVFLVAIAAGACLSSLYQA